MHTSMSGLQSQNYLDHEFRTPIVTFAIYSTIITMIVGSGTGTSTSASTGFDSDSTRNDLHLGLILPSIEFWIQITQMMIIQGLIGCLMALVVHKFIIKKRNTSSASTSTTTIFIIG